MRTVSILILLAAPMAAVANGSGGGGGSMPSMSAPAYNPAEEYRKGIAALNEKNFKDAARAFGHVLDASPRDANSNYLAGLSYAGLDDLKRARGFFEKAVKYDDSLIQAHKELGVTYAKLGDKGKAGAELAALKARADKCGATCPEAADLKAAISVLSTALGDGKQARIETAPPLLFASADAGDHAYLTAVALINEHRYEEAIVALQDAEKAFGPHPDVLTYLGFANRKLGRYAAAEAYYLKALAIAPGHRGATEYYGELMVERGDLAGARAKLAALDASCAFGCYEAEELRRWIAAGRAPGS
jgi:tetratricopeptide (TPR) repeat protein